LEDAGHWIGLFQYNPSAASSLGSNLSSLKITNGRHKQTSGQYPLAGQKIYKKTKKVLNRSASKSVVWPSKEREGKGFGKWTVNHQIVNGDIAYCNTYIFLACNLCLFSTQPKPNAFQYTSLLQ
jgi:hypothetical protein